LSLPFRVINRTVVGPRNASARMPSYFGSKLQPASAGTSVPIDAYIGSSAFAAKRVLILKR
jgi:hypothetical protein